MFARLHGGGIPDSDSDWAVACMISSSIPVLRRCWSSSSVCICIGRFENRAVLTAADRALDGTARICLRSVDAQQVVHTLWSE